MQNISFSNIIIGIDPGPTEIHLTAFCPEKQKVITAQTIDINVNDMRDCRLKNVISDLYVNDYRRPLIFIEKISSYGMIAGNSTFETQFNAGFLFGEIKRYMENALYFRDTSTPYCVMALKRQEVKKILTNNVMVNDRLIREYLKSNFGDKGDRKNPGFFYGFRADLWQAFACGLAGAALLNIPIKDQNGKLINFYINKTDKKETR